MSNQVLVELKDAIVQLEHRFFIKRQLNSGREGLNFFI